jgi:hypothetical protein
MVVAVVLAVAAAERCRREQLQLLSAAKPGREREELSAGGLLQLALVWLTVQPRSAAAAAAHAIVYTLCPSGVHPGPMTITYRAVQGQLVGWTTLCRLGRYHAPVEAVMHQPFELDFSAEARPCRSGRKRKTIRIHCNARLAAGQQGSTLCSAQFLAHLCSSLVCIG